jgi:hypothetical protein
MTTPYSVTTSKGSVTYNSYVNAPITGPLSTNQFPSTIPYHSYGILNGIRPTPPQFYPAQEPINSNMGVNARQHYLRTSQTVQSLAKQRKLAVATPSGNSHFSFSTGKSYNVSNHTNYIEPIPSSMRTSILKKNAVGQSAYKVNLPVSAGLATKNYQPSSTRTTIRRVRSGGCVAPKKKGAIENYSLQQGGTCCWGGIVRSNY